MHEVTRRLVTTILLAGVIGAAGAVSTAVARSSRPADAGPSVTWTQQFGTTGLEAVSATAVDPTGNVFVTGWIRNAAGTDTAGFVRRHTSSGTFDWIARVRTAGFEGVFDVAVDGQGHAWVVGNVSGRLPGQTRKGGYDAFIREYGPDGSILWTEQFGTTEYDAAYSVAVDSSRNVYVAGMTGGSFPGQSSGGSMDGFVRKYGPDGSVVWTRQFGSTRRDEVSGIGVDGAGAATVVGTTEGALPGQVSAGGRDAFVRRYGPAGAIAWTRQFGTVLLDEATSVAVDGRGSLSVVGRTAGTLPAQTTRGGQDAFIRRYSRTGSVAWTRQFGTRRHDGATSVAIDPQGGAVVAGSTSDAFSGETSAGGSDAFLRAYAPDGTVAWTRQFGTAGDDEGKAVAANAAGDIVVAGTTWGAFPGWTNKGGSDAFLRTY